MMNDTPNSALTALSSEEIDRLISERRLLRILQPALKTQMCQALQEDTAAQPYFLESEGQLYLSLDWLEDDPNETDFFKLIQHYQAGEAVNLKALPPQVKRVLQPEMTGFGRFIGAILLGAVAGIIAGVLAMAITVLFSGGLELITGQPAPQYAGMGLASISFILFTFLAWLALAILAWQKPHLWVQRQSGANTESG